MRVEKKHGPFGLFTRVTHKTERKAVNRQVEVVGAHWVLETRNHHIERNVKLRNGKHQETTHEQHYLILLPDGALKKVVVWEEEI